MMDQGGVMCEKFGLSENLDTMVGGLKNNISIWEEFIVKTNKLNGSIKGTLQSSAGFLESFQKLADYATNSPGGLRDVGATLTRFCIRQRGVESKIKHLNRQLADSLATPLQDRVEEWRRVNSQFDRERQKDWRRARNDLQKALAEADRLRKKSSKKASSDAPDTRLQLDFAQQDLVEKRQLLEDMERAALKRAVVEERKRFLELICCLKPVLDSQLGLLNEMSCLEELVSTLYSASTDPAQLPQETENFLCSQSLSGLPSNAGGSSSSGPSNHPGSSITSASCRSSSLGTTASVVSGGANRLSISSHASTSSTTSNTSGVAPASASHYACPAIGVTPGNQRVPSVSSQDSGFTSHDPRKPKDLRNGDTDHSSMLEDISQGWVALSDATHTSSTSDPQPVYDDPTFHNILANNSASIDTPLHHKGNSSSEEGSSSGTEESESEEDNDQEQDRTAPSSPARTLLSNSAVAGYDPTTGKTAAVPTGMAQLRRHTIGSAAFNTLGSNARPGLSTSTFKPNPPPAVGTAGNRQSLYPNQALPPPIYANMNELHSAARRKYGRHIETKTSKEDQNSLDDESCGSSTHSDIQNDTSQRVAAVPFISGDSPVEVSNLLVEPPPCFRSSANTNQKKVNQQSPFFRQIATESMDLPSHYYYDEDDNKDLDENVFEAGNRPQEGINNGWMSLDDSHIPSWSPSMDDEEAEFSNFDNSMSGGTALSTYATLSRRDVRKGASSMIRQSLLPSDMTDWGRQSQPHYRMHQHQQQQPPQPINSQSANQPYMRSLSADQSECSPVMTHRQPRRQHQQQEQQPPLVNENNSTAASSFSHHRTPPRRSNSTSRSGEPTAGDANTKNRYTDLTGVRTRCPSVSSSGRGMPGDSRRPSLPPKPRMSMYGTVGRNSSVSRELQDDWRRRRDDACTSFVGYSSLSASVDPGTLHRNSPPSYPENGSQSSRGPGPNDLLANALRQGVHQLRKVQQNSREYPQSPQLQHRM